jgi:hypothetical protein
MPRRFNATTSYLCHTMNAKVSCNVSGTFENKKETKSLKVADLVVVNRSFRSACCCWLCLDPLILPGKGIWLERSLIAS